jgi:hypothetical protein
MEVVVVALGALGAWLLVAGPVFQAALELREQELDHDAFDEALSAVDPPRRLSAWWWLLPPVAYFLQRQRTQVHRNAVMKALNPEQLEQTLTFLNKAGGWLLVGLGAFFIAVKETWELVELLHWPDWVFWVLIVVMTLLAIGNTVARMIRTEQAMGHEKPVPRQRTARP